MEIIESFININYEEITNFDNNTSLSLQLPCVNGKNDFFLAIPDGGTIPSEYKIYKSDNPSDIIEEGTINVLYADDYDGYYYLVESQNNPDIKPTIKEYLISMELFND